MIPVNMPAQRGTEQCEEAVRVCDRRDGDDGDVHDCAAGDAHPRASSLRVMKPDASTPQSWIGSRLTALAIGALLVAFSRANAQEFVFQQASSHTVSGAEAIAAHDLDNDGDKDLVVASLTPVHSVVVLYNEGDFNFVPGQTLAVTYPWDVAVEDLNNDGLADIVITSMIADTITGYYHNAPGDPPGYTLGFEIEGVDGAAGLALADVDNDSRIDIIVAKRLEDQIGVFINMPTGDWIELEYPTISRPSAVCTGNFDNVGGIDLAVVSSEGSTVTFMYGSGTGAFPAQSSFYLGTDDSLWDVAKVDLNGDSRDDVIVPCPAANAIGVFYSATLGGYYPLVLYTSQDSPLAVAGRDCNNDQIPELLSLNSGTGSLTVHLGGGVTSGSFDGIQQYSSPTWGATSTAMVVEDLNGDGRPDIAVTERTAHEVRILANQVPAAVLRGDVLGDGAVDLSDAIGLLNYLFAAASVACVDALDINDDGSVLLTDVLLLVGGLFGSAPWASPICELDPTPDALAPCVSSSCP